ncbi:sterol carrier protein 2 [Tyrophagus putrescentiae]|nr:sterol carrier protein 2 [Tyrophagus putrescentiae]
MRKGRRKTWKLPFCALRPSFDFLTKMQCCPTSDGAAAVLLASEDFLRAHRHLEAQAVEILALEMVTDTEATFAEPRSAIRLIGGEMTALAAQAAYHRAAVTPAEVDVIELHDCFSANELITYEALGLCPTGQAKALVERGDNTYGGKWVINPSGGLLGKGHPLGATGVAQCVELCWQLRGLAGRRQVTNARLALQHNIGLGGAAVVAIYRMMHSAQSTRRAPN